MLKDNMIDEEKAKAEAAAHETHAETVVRLEAELETVMKNMTELMERYQAFQVNIYTQWGFTQGISFLQCSVPLSIRNDSSHEEVKAT